MTDYSTTKPTNPWSLAHNLSLVAADLDGDGFEEVVAIACDSVGVLKYFDWSELSSGWSDVTSFGGLVTLGASITSIASSNAAWVYLLSSLDQIQAFAVSVGGATSDYLVIHRPGFAITVVQWTGTALEVLTQASAPSAVTEGGAVWDCAPGDRLYIADIDGDGSDEFVMQAASGAIGLVQYTASGGLQTVWMATSQIPFYGQGNSWTLSGSDGYTIGDVNGDGADEIVIHNPSAVNVGIVAASGSGLQLTWSCAVTVSGTAPWTIGPSDQYLVWHDGSSAVVGVFDLTGANDMGGAILVPQKDGSLSSVTYTGIILSGTGGWKLTPQTQLFLADVNGDGVQELVLYDGPGQSLAVASLGSNYSLREQWSAQYDASTNAPTVPPSGTEGGAGWIVGTANQLFPAHLTGSVSGAPVFQLLVLDEPSSALGVLGAPAKQYSLACELDLWQFVPGWGIPLLASAPSTPLPPFTTGSQPEIYAYISNLLIQKPDIRDYYGTGVVKGQGSTLAGKIPGLDRGPYDGTEYDGDWKQVATTLIGELDCVDGVTTEFDILLAMEQDLYNLQTTELVNAASNCTLTTNEAQYWTGQVGIALVWGGSAIPFTPLTQVGLAMAASLMGSLATDPAAGGTSTTLPYSKIAGQISADFASWVNLASANELTILADDVMLPTMSQLTHDGWVLPDIVSIPISLPHERYAYYQSLLPAFLIFVVWTNPEYPTPYYEEWQMNPGGEGGSWYATQLDAPQGSYWNGSVNGTSTMVLLCGGSASNIAKVEMPGSDLLTDLFTTLQIQPYDFFNGVGPWGAISRQAYSNPSSD